MESRSSEQRNTIVQTIVMTEECIDGAAFIDKMCAATQALDNYSSQYEMLVYKEHPPIVQTGVFFFKKPHLMRIEVQKGPKKGSVAILAADGKVHGHLGGALKFFQAALSPDSDLVRAANGFPMVSTDYYSLAVYLKNMLKQGDHSRVSKSPIQTKKVSYSTYILDMYTNKSGKDILLKRIYTNPQTLYPVFWEDYTDGKLWSENTWHDMKTSVDFADNFFKP